MNYLPRWLSRPPFFDPMNAGMEHRGTMSKRRQALAVRTRGRILTLVFLALAFGGWIWHLLRTPEPTYDGHPLSYWVTAHGYLKVNLRPHSVEDVQRFERCDAAARHIGTNAIPYLLKWADYRPSPALKFTRVIFRKLHLETSHTTRLLYAREYRAGGVPYSFLQLGANAAPAIPELARIASNTRNRETVDRVRACLTAILETAESKRQGAPHCALVSAAFRSGNPILREAASNAVMYVEHGLFPPAPNNTPAQ